MTIIKFPGKVAARAQPLSVAKPAARINTRGRVRMAIVCTVWAFAVLTWPLLKWIAALDCTWQLLRMLYYWDTPGVYAGWTFGIHVLGFVALTYFVDVYRPEWPSKSS